MTFVESKVFKLKNKVMSKLPKHRILMMESLELLFSGKKAEFKKKLTKAKAETNKFYSIKSKTK
jgi:hypothetical protein